MKLKLPKVVLAMLKKRGGTVDGKLHATKAKLTTTCKAHNYPLHPSVVAFESAFGGLLIPEDGSKLRKNEPCWLFGAHACLTSGAHVTPRGGVKLASLCPLFTHPTTSFIISMRRAEGSLKIPLKIRQLSFMLITEHL